MNISDLIKNTLRETQQLMTSKTVVGDPIQAGEHTVIPVSKVTFGFGGGGAEGTEKNKGGTGQGVGGGWSIEPIAFVVIGKDSVKLMTIGDRESISGKLMDLAPKVMDSVKDFMQKNNDGKTDKSEDK